MVEQRKDMSGGFLLLAVCGLGDAVAYLSLIRALRRTFPGSAIRVVVASDAAGDLIQNCIHDIEILVFNRSKPLPLRKKLDLLLSLRTRRPAIVISAAAATSFRVPLLAFFSGARVRVGANVEKFSFLYNRLVQTDPGANVVEQYRQLLSGVGINMSVDELTPVLSPPICAKESASLLWKQAGLGSHKMVVGITSGADTILRGKWRPSLKRWNAEGYAEVVKWVNSELRCGVVIFGAAAERSIGEEIRARAESPLVNLCGKTTVGELQWMLKWCAGLVCNDTGTMHLAAALGTPVVSLFGPTNPTVFAPLRNYHRVVQGHAPCSPCFPNPTCDRAACLAMDAITAEEVIHTIAGMRSGW
jgi:lipopolysaccharide heptosyltransferase II